MIIQDRNDIKIKGKKVVILGLGISGIAAASLAAHKGANVFVSDQNSSESLIDSLEEPLGSRINS